MNAPLRALDASRDSEALTIPLVAHDASDNTSAECVLQVISDLKKLYQRRNFSHLERFGKPEPLAQSVLEQLDRAQEDTLAWLAQARASNRQPRLHSAISVSFPAV